MRVSSISGYILTGHLPGENTFSQNGNKQESPSPKCVGSLVGSQTLYKQRTSYRATLQPTWTYGMQRSGTDSASNTETFECFQSKALYTLVRAEYGYPKRSPNTNNQRWISQLELSVQCSPLHTPKRRSSEPHGATRQQQATAKTPAKLSVYQILTVIVVFVVIGFKVQFASLTPKSHNMPTYNCSSNNCWLHPSLNK
jgi:hypothetical protein